jgi:hypothetical protein
MHRRNGEGSGAGSARKFTGSLARQLVLALGLIVAVPSAHADEPAGDVGAAARAFEEGQRAQLRRDYVQAADLFALADRIAPSAPALRSAIRSYEAAGNPAQAATLAVRARQRYSADAATRQLAEGVLARLSPALGRAVIHCAPSCSLVVDGRAAAETEATEHEVYLPPGDHTVVAVYSDGRKTASPLHSAAGATSDRSLEPTTPPIGEAKATPSAPPPQPAAVAASAPASGSDKRSWRLPPLVPLLGGVVTVGLGAVLIWSGADTLSARDRYVKDPTEARYNDGVSRQTRTNALIGTVAVLGAATAAVAIFATNWRGGLLGKRHERAVALIPKPDFDGIRTTLGLSGSF